MTLVLVILLQNDLQVVDQAKLQKHEFLMALIQQVQQNIQRQLRKIPLTVIIIVPEKEPLRLWKKHTPNKKLQRTLRMLLKNVEEYPEIYEYLCSCTTHKFANILQILIIL